MGSRRVRALARARNIPVAGAVGRIYAACGLRRSFGAHGRAVGTDARGGGRTNFGLMRCTASRVHQRSGLVFPTPPAYLPIRRVLFLASDGNIPVALSKSE